LDTVDRRANRAARAAFGFLSLVVATAIATAGAVVMGALWLVAAIGNGALHTIWGDGGRNPTGADFVPVFGCFVVLMSPFLVSAAWGLVTSARPRSG
jgi:hypothetical protein